MDDLETFLTTTLGDQIHLVAIPPDDGATVGRDFGIAFEAAARWARDRNAEGMNVYFTVNRVRSGVNKKPAKADIVAVRCAHVDIDPPKDGSAWDAEAAYQQLADAPIEPTFVNWSGNGWQAFWRLGDATVTEAEAINQGLIVHFNGDPGTHNIDRLMRLPGTVNYPNQKKTKAGRVQSFAKIENDDDGTVVSAAEMLTAYPGPAGGEIYRERQPLYLGEINPLTANDLGLPADDSLRSLIESPKGADRSRDVMVLAGAMVRSGYADEQIAGVLLNQANAISAHCLDQSSPVRAAQRAIGKARNDEEQKGPRLADFHAYMPAHNYIFGPTGESWPAASINSRFPPVALTDRQRQPLLDDKGKVRLQSPAGWLDQNKAVEQVTWAPGEPQVVSDRLISDGGWIDRRGCNVFNFYRPAALSLGNRSKAALWVDHIRTVYPDDAEHLICWLAHRVQQPSVKINHALVLGGSQGIGKDTILEPVKAAIGPWNFAEVSPQQMLGRFNSYVKSVILRVSEARDLGDVDRFAFYDHMKTYTAAPPDVLRVDEKHLREYSVMNVCGVIITTNHRLDGVYLPPDDRRHYVAWSNLTRDQFGPEYWTQLYSWYASGGIGHVAAYLNDLPLDGFDPKAPPKQTPAFWDIVGANQAPEDAELADALDHLHWPDVVTIEQIRDAAQGHEFVDWLRDRRNARRIPHRLSECGYVAVRNPYESAGRFRIAGKRCTVYAKQALEPQEAIKAASVLAGEVLGGS